MVLVFHFDLIASAHGGFTGVDVFFVISGFLITSISEQQIAAGSFSLSRFYLNRIRRLAPALFATLLIVTLAGLVWLYPSDMVELSKQVLVSQTYVANIYYWRTINYFGIDSSSAFLLHTWSLAVEEQFYLLYPFFLIAAYRYVGKYIWQIILIALMVSFSLNIVFVNAKPEATFYLLPTRAWELLIGALVVWLRARLAFSVSIHQCLGILGLILIGSSFVGYEKTLYFPGYFALLPTIGAALVILSAAGQPTLFSSLLGNPVMTYIGKISYPLYLIHWPLNVFAARLMTESYSPQARWLGFALSFVIASSIFHLVEEPIRAGALISSARSLRNRYLMGIAATVLLCSAIYLTDGIPQRFHPEAVRLANFAKDRTPDLRCQFHKGKIDIASFCRIGRAATAPTWLIYGDSHAWAAYAAFDKWLQGIGEAGLFIFRHSCPPLEGVHLVRSPECFEFNNEVLDFVDRSAEIRNVLLVSTWVQAREGLLTTSENLVLSKVESVALFKRQFRATVAQLKRHGLRVNIWEPVPGTRHSAPQALARSYPNNGQLSLEITKAQYLSNFDFFFDTLEQSKDLIEATVSPSAALCGTGICSATIDGDPAYFDNGHIAASTYNFWAEILAKSIPRESKSTR